MKANRNIIIAILALVACCAVSVWLNVYSVGELPATFIGAALGAVITGVITVVLLDGQSKAEEVKERNVRVFDKKSVLFSEYIDVVWEAWEDRIVTAEEYRQLTKDYYKKLMLYLKESSAKVIGLQLKKIGAFAGNETITDSEKATLQTALIAIINTLSDEISLGGHIDESLFIEIGDELEKARSRRTNTSFKMLGIKPKTELVLKSDTSVKCITVDDKNMVEYEGEQLKISALSSRILGRSSNGFSEFMLGDKTLFELRGK